MSPPSAASRAGQTVVVRGGALGDGVLAFPLLRALRAARPAARLALVAPERGGRLAAEVGLADVRLRLDRPDADALLEAEARSARWVVYLRADVEARRQALTRGGAAVVGGDPHPPPGVHASDHLAALAAPLGLAPVPASALEVPPSAAGAARARLERAGVDPLRAVALAWGSGKSATRWPTPRFAELARRLDGLALQPFWLSGPVEADLGLAPPGPGPSIDSDSPLESAGLLAASRAMVGNDTGTTHLAAAFGVPTVALFGATDPRQWAPRGPRVRVLGSRRAGMDALDVDPVLAAVRALLDGPGR